MILVRLLIKINGVFVFAEINVNFIVANRLLGGQNFGLRLHGCWGITKFGG